MKKRRSLTEGIKPDPATEYEFVFGAKTNPPKEEPSKKTQTRKPKEPRAAATAPIEHVPADPVTPPPSAIPLAPAGREPSRVPFTTRIRSDLANSLKEASLKRQLTRERPHTVQEILEEALEPWLKNHGYLP